MIPSRPLAMRSVIRAAYSHAQSVQAQKAFESSMSTLCHAQDAKGIAEEIPKLNELGIRLHSTLCQLQQARVDYALACMPKRHIRALRYRSWPLLIRLGLATAKDRWTREGATYALRLDELLKERP